MEPEYKSGKSAWEENIPFAFELVKERKPKLIVELGIHYGDSYFAFCQAVKEYNLPTKCWGFDLFEGDDLTGYYGLEVLKQVQEENKKYIDFSFIVVHSFDKACELFKDGDIDLLHIDGSHYYAEVKHDFETWFPKVANGGVILLHDTKVMKEPYGVWKFWKEIKNKFVYKEFDNQYGLGVLYL